MNKLSPDDIRLPISILGYIYPTWPRHNEPLLLLIHFSSQGLSSPRTHSLQIYLWCKRVGWYNFPLYWRGCSLLWLARPSLLLGASLSLLLIDRSRSTICFWTASIRCSQTAWYNANEAIMLRLVKLEYTKIYAFLLLVMDSFPGSFHL
jgi:hypothetical protein